MGCHEEGSEIAWLKTKFLKIIKKTKIKKKTKKKTYKLFCHFNSKKKKLILQKHNRQYKNFIYIKPQRQIKLQLYK